jgi:hypothetical protein
MRLSGLLTVTAGALLAAVSVLQALHLRAMPDRARTECARAELRGLVAALRWRMERDLCLRDSNLPSTRRALEELAADWPAVRWAALHEADGRRLTSCGAAEEVSPDEIREELCRRPDVPPAIRSRPGGSLVGLVRLSVARRELVLAAGLSAPDVTERGTLAALSAGSLIAGLAAAALLVIRGLTEKPGRGRPEGPAA